MINSSQALFQFASISGCLLSPLKNQITSSGEDRKRVRRYDGRRDITGCLHCGLMRPSNRNFNIPTGKPRAFELFKIGSFKFPPPRARMVFKCPTRSSHFVCQMPLLKNNRRRFLSSAVKPVYIRCTQRHQLMRESYFRRWLRGTLYALRTRNTY